VLDVVPFLGVGPKPARKALRLIAHRSLSHALCVLTLLGALLGCGARTSLHEPEGAGGASNATSTASGDGRTCFDNCTVGHACCVGGCDGPAVPLSSDCCTCLAGETNSIECPNDKCGKDPTCKINGSGCSMASECCSHICDYLGANAEKKNCLP
jgi:hypothetical protein